MDDLTEDPAHEPDNEFCEIMASIAASGESLDSVKDPATRAQILSSMVTANEMLKTLASWRACDMQAAFTPSTAVQ